MVFTREKDVEAGELRERYVDILQHISVRKIEILEILVCNRMDKSSAPDGIYPRI